MQSTANSIALILSWIHKGIQFQNPIAEFYLRRIKSFGGRFSTTMHVCCARHTSSFDVHNNNYEIYVIQYTQQGSFMIIIKVVITKHGAVM